MNVVNNNVRALTLFIAVAALSLALVVNEFRQRPGNTKGWRPAGMKSNWWSPMSKGLTSGLTMFGIRPGADADEIIADLPRHVNMSRPQQWEDGITSFNLTDIGGEHSLWLLSSPSGPGKLGRIFYVRHKRGGTLERDGIIVVAIGVNAEDVLKNMGKPENNPTSDIWYYEDRRFNNTAIIHFSKGGIVRDLTLREGSAAHGGA